MVLKSKSDRDCILARYRHPRSDDNASLSAEPKVGAIEYRDRLNRLTILTAKGAGSRGPCGQICVWPILRGRRGKGQT